MVQYGSSYFSSFMAFIPSYYGVKNTIGLLNAKKKTKTNFPSYVMDQVTDDVSFLLMLQIRITKLNFGC